MKFLASLRKRVKKYWAAQDINAAKLFDKIKEDAMVAKEIVQKAAIDRASIGYSTFYLKITAFPELFTAINNYKNCTKSKAKSISRTLSDIFEIPAILLDESVELNWCLK